MARNTATPQDIDEDVAKDLEGALEKELVADDGTGDLDIAASMEDFERQISEAAEELSRDTEPKRTEPNHPEPKRTEPKHKAELRPVEPRPSTAAPAALAPANDDRQNEYQAFRRSLSKRTPTTIYWITALLSIAWISGGLALGNLLYGPAILQISSFEQLLATPQLIVLAVTIIFPVLLFWSFAVMVRRAHEMKLAARSMSEIAFRLAEPESLAQDRVMTVGQAVRRELSAMSDGVERTLARAVELETLVHTEVNELERAYSENETRIRKLVDGLGAEREAVISHAERVRSSISGTHEALKDELDTASDIIRQNIVDTSTQLSLTITESGNSLIERLNDRATDLHSAIDERLDKTITERLTTSGEAFAELLDTRISRLTEATEGASQSLAQLLDERTTSIVEVLGDAGRTMSEQFDSNLQQIETSLKDRGQALLGEFKSSTEMLETSTEKLNAALHARVRQINDTLLERSREIAQTFNDGRNNMTSLIDASKEVIGSEMSELLTSTSQMLESRAADFTARLTAGRDIVSEALQADLQRLEQARSSVDSAVAGQIDEIAESRKRMAEALQADLGKLAETRAEIENVYATHIEKLAQGRTNMSTALEVDLRSLAESRSKIDSTIQDHLQHLAERQSELTTVLSNDVARVEDMFHSQTGIIEERTQSMQRALEMGVDNVRKSLENSAVVIAGSLREKVLEATSVLGEQAEKAVVEVDKRIGESIAHADGTLSRRADHIASVFDEAEHRLTSRIEESSASLAARADDIAKVFAESDQRIAGRAEETANLLQDRIGDLAASFQDTDIRLGQRAIDIARTFEDVDQRIIQRTHQTSAELDARAGQIAEALSSVDDKLVDGASHLIARIDDHVSEAQSRLSSGADSIGERLSEQVARAEAHLVDRANVIAETFAAVNQHIGERSAEASRSIEATTSQLNQVLAARSSEIARILDETARPLVERFAESGNEFQQSLEVTSNRMSEQIRSESAALVNALASRTSETLGALEMARGQLSDNVSDLIDRLSSSNTQLGQLVDIATTNLGGLEERIAETTESFIVTNEKAAQSFASSTRLIDANANRLSEISSQTLQEITEIANRFDAHGKILENASALLGAAQDKLASTLDGRKSELEQLASGLLSKSEEIESVMRSFESVLQQTLERTEARTRTSTDQLQEAISGVVESAGKRFSDATEEIRRAASTIRTELEDTRTELKRGIQDLPEETRESTTAMRRAVSEQINALKELADIVAKSGRAFDASDGRGPGEPTRLAAPLRPAEPERPFAPPQAPASPAPSAYPAMLERNAAPATEASAQPRPREAQSATQQSGGWVRDLLRGASRQDEPPVAQAPAAPTVQPGSERSRLHLVESLNSLSVDIARAIDHEASIELWNRYRRGERNVFTRRLYTLKGQQTFDEIRRKYRADSEFKAAVDRYCQDFEKLLKDVSKNDRDNMMGQTYLTSDTGKVYTMLAHASGRLR